MAGNVAAVVLAAGLSSRMGEFKPLLPLAGVTALERIVRTFREAGVDDVRVVAGYRKVELEPLVQRLGCRMVENRHYLAGMFSSATAGIATLEREIDAFFVQPVDVPLVRSATIRRLIGVWQESNSDLLYPCFLGRRGHPPLIAGRHAGAIAGWRGSGGLSGILARWETSALDVAVADELVLHDMDTPAAYRSLAARAADREVPTSAECAALLSLHRVDGKIIGHGQEVSRVALALAERLNRSGLTLDLQLLHAAALLHDLARQEPDHAEAGARYLRDAGFGGVADLVATHMDLAFEGDDEIGEAAILFLADKLVKGNRQVSLSERFRPALELHADEPAIIGKIRRRLEAARLIQERLESLIGQPLTLLTEQSIRAC